jgi:hypothetical protein
MKRINPANFEAIPAFAEGNGRRRVHAVIETPRDTRHKYAFEPKLGSFKLKLTDPLDIFVLDQIERTTAS